MNNEIIKNKIWKTGYVVGILLAVFLAVVSIKEFKSIGSAGKDAYINTISIDGKGEVVGIPDVATFSFSVTETAKAVDEAQVKATTKINTALKALKDGGVAEKDIKTLSYTINPHYEYDPTGALCAAQGISKVPCRPGVSVLTGYDVSQGIEVKVRDIAKAGALFTTIGSLNVQNVNGLTFSIDDIEKLKAQARDLAIARAKEKAGLLAKKLGVKLVRITSFYDQNEAPTFPYAAEGMGGGVMMKATASSVPPQIPSGEQKITSHITITYEIK